MIMIETKYFGYYKPCRILRLTTNKRPMNTNTTHVLASTVTAGIFATVLGIAITGSTFAGAVIGASYFTVAALIGMAFSDYRPASKPYFAAPLVKGHFQGSLDKQPRQAAKSRLAA